MVFPRGGRRPQGPPSVCLFRGRDWVGTRQDGSVGGLAVPHAFCLAFLTGVTGQLRGPTVGPAPVGCLRVGRVAFCVRVRVVLGVCVVSASERLPSLASSGVCVVPPCGSRVFWGLPLGVIEIHSYQRAVGMSQTCTRACCMSATWVCLCALLVAVAEGTFSHTEPRCA